MTIKNNKKFIIHTLLLVVLTAAMIWLGTTLYSAAQLPIQQVNIVGKLQHLNHDEITSVALPYVQDTFLSINVSVLKQRLEQLPWIKQATVSRAWPDSVLIQITEQQAIAHWQDDKLINSEGDVFSSAGKIVSAELPWLFGPTDHAQKVLTHYQDMSDLLLHLGLRVNELRLSKRQAWTLTLNNGMKLQLGRVEPLKQLTRFVRAYNAVFGSNGTTVQLVDLRYPNGMAVRWNKEKK